MTASQSPRNLGSRATYRIVFWGETANGASRNSVAQAFAERFGIKSRQQLAKLFSGKVITLKHSLGLEQAHRYVTAIQELGGVCRMEGESKNYFFEQELKVRNNVSFLQNDVDMDSLTLAPK